MQYLEFRSAWDTNVLDLELLNERIRAEGKFDART